MLSSSPRVTNDSAVGLSGMDRCRLRSAEEVQAGTESLEAVVVGPGLDAVQPVNQDRATFGRHDELRHADRHRPSVRAPFRRAAALRWMSWIACRI